MIEILKEAGIFIVIAQAVLYLVPGEAYEKYIKVIIGVIMIAKLVQPILTLFSEDMTEDSFEKILEQSEDLFELAVQEKSETETTDSKTVIFEEIERELRDKLNEKPLEGYVVEDVSLTRTKDDEISSVIITVSGGKKDVDGNIAIEKIIIGDNEEKKADESDEVAALKEYYGQVISADPRQIEICMN